MAYQGERRRSRHNNVNAPPDLQLAMTERIEGGRLMARKVRTRRIIRAVITPAAYPAIRRNG
jgi:hypothetical protein